MGFTVSLSVLRQGSLSLSSGLPVLVGTAAAMIGLIYGYDSSNIAGALLFLKPYFHLSDTGQQMLATMAVVGQIMGTIVGGPLSNRYGRRIAMLVVAGAFAVFSAFSGLAPTLSVLAAVRFALGVTIGVSLVVAPVFLAEASPTRIRGSLLVLYQVVTVIGIIAGYLVAWAVAPTRSWRVMLGVATIPALLVLPVLLRLPETARWHMMQGRREKAREALCALDPAADPDAELGKIAGALADEHGTRLSDLVAEMTRAPYLRATLFVAGLGFFVQITGINAVVYYSPRIFQAMGQVGNVATLGLPALVQFCGLVAVLVSLVTVDRMGRRPVLLNGIAIMIAANVLLLGVFASGTDHFTGVRTALGLAGMVLFTIGYTFGFGALVWVYAGETFPAHLRSLGAGVMLTCDLVANAAVSMFFLTVLHALGGAETFALFGVAAVAALGFVWRLAPETRGRSLEDIRHFWADGGRWR